MLRDPKPPLGGNSEKTRLRCLCFKSSRVKTERFSGKELFVEAVAVIEKVLKLALKYAVKYIPLTVAAYICKLPKHENAYFL